jgi:hypothetical protein
MEYLQNNQQTEFPEPVNISPETMAIALAALVAICLIAWWLWPKSTAALSGTAVAPVGSVGISIAEMAELLR